ncbi:MAG: hypothetical protein JEZ03_18080 [Bacteroidales bacterium]|nr:hypothetical protein [Bacteroidales bacterium]
MPFFEDIEKYNSLSIVGLEKNTGKTECLNYVLKRLSSRNMKLALTSIGIDGESRDQVCQTHKPEITVYEDMIFVTSEMHYKSRKLVSEILNLSTQSTSLGRLVTARAKSTDKAMISGPAETAGLKRLIMDMQKYAVDLTIVDGALSRMSLSSPAVTDAMILATGAAYSSNIPQLVYKTKYIYDLINLPELESDLGQDLSEIEKGVYAIGSDDQIYDLNISSVFMLEKVRDRLFEHGYRLFVSGAVTDKLFNYLKSQKEVAKIELIVKDFTRIFAVPEVFYSFIKKGGKVKVLQKTKLLAVTINPVSPDGYKLDSDELKQAMQDKLQIPVYDVRKL